MTETTKKKLEETKNKFVVKGKVRGIVGDRAFREGVTKADRNYKALSFHVDTQAKNSVLVEIFGQETDTVVFYSGKEKKSKKVPFADRHKPQKGYRLMGVNTTFGEEKRTLAHYDAVDYLLQNLNDGDSIEVKGRMDLSEFENQQGEKVQKRSFRIDSIKTIPDIDFADPEYTEVASFEQDIVVLDTYKEDETEKLYVNARTINHRGDLFDTQFVVDIQANPKFATNMEKNLGFGDSIRVLGKMVNYYVTEEVEEVVEDDGWGGVAPAGTKEVLEYHIKEMVITDVYEETYEKGKYTEEDFFNEDEENFGEEETELDDEDLPFE